MSIHEYEAVVEQSVRTLSRSGRPDRRDLYKCLYDFQAEFDTGYTHFRVMDLLLDARSVYRFTMDEHPHYDRYRDAGAGSTD